MLLDDQIRRNRWKSWGLFAGFFLVYAVVGAAVSFALAGWELQSNVVVFAIFAAVAIVVVGFTLFMGDDMAVAVAGGRRVTDRKQAPELWDAVETMSITAGIQMPRVYISPDPSPNAFAAGRSERQALVCANRGLLARLDKEELEGVIAHEISHVRNLDVRLMTYAAVLAGSIALLSEFVLRGAIWGDADSRGGVIGLIVVVLAALLAPIAALLIQLAISRRREFLADASAADLTRYPQGLASALRQLASSQVRPAHDRNAIAHLYIVPPRMFKEKTAGLFSTHPPISERLARLDGLAGGQMHVHQPRARSAATEEMLSAGR
ncbi:MAG TPA: M48 family metalloprotease [Solirubrobacterales bacterium]|nr:M48 family metalloprotease [Solirubrobacterales bacterium]